MEHFSETSFETDDKHFRTVTTLLQLIGQKNPAAEDSNATNNDVLKYLAITCFIIARHSEVVAAIPKLSVAGVKVYLTYSDKGHEVYVPSVVDDETPLDEHCLLVARNPPNRDKTDKKDASLLDRVTLSPNVTFNIKDIDKSVATYIWLNWKMPFNRHVQTVAYLIQSIKDATKPVATLFRLSYYIIWNHALKLRQRIISANLPAKYLELFVSIGNDDAAFTEHRAAVTFDLISVPDKARLAETMADWENLDMKEFGGLHAFVNGGAVATSDQPSILRAFHRFFAKVLEQARSNFVDLRNLTRKSQRPSEETIRATIEVCLPPLVFLEHFAWTSNFFKSYIQLYLDEALRSALRQYKANSNKADVKEPSPGDIASESGETADYPQPFQGYIASEYVEVAMEDNLGREMDSEVLAWLRLISATEHYILALFDKPVLRQYALKNIEFQVVEYPTSSPELQPWRDVITNLYRDPAEANKTITALETRYGPGGSHVQGQPGNIISLEGREFSGRPHCEAMLAVAHFLSRHGEGVSDKITAEVLDAMRNSKPLIAASKRCCVVCTQILHAINAAASEMGEGPYYPILWSHRHIFACPLPPGTPVKIRDRVLPHFDDMLKSQLDAINFENEQSNVQRSASNASTQSEALDIASGEEADGGAWFKQVKATGVAYL